MLNPARVIVGMACSSAIVLSACSHDWENLAREEATETSASSASSGSSSSGGSGGGVSSTSSSNSSSGTGGSGGGNGCGLLMPSVPQCGTIVGTFDDQAQFDADWNLSGDPGKLTAVGGEAVLTLDTTDGTTFAGTHTAFTYQDCGVWVQIVEADTDDDVMVRLSIANPFASSRFSIGVLAPNLAAYGGETNLFAVPYDSKSMRFVRMREEGGMVHFGYSADGKCWTEIGKIMNTLQENTEARIAVTHVPDGNGSAGSARFDNYCVTMP